MRGWRHLPQPTGPFVESWGNEVIPRQQRTPTDTRCNISSMEGEEFAPRAGGGAEVDPGTCVECVQDPPTLFSHGVQAAGIDGPRCDRYMYSADPHGVRPGYGRLLYIWTGPDEIRLAFCCYEAQENWEDHPTGWDSKSLKWYRSVCCGVELPYRHYQPRWVGTRRWKTAKHWHAQVR